MCKASITLQSFLTQDLVKVFSYFLYFKEQGNPIFFGRRHLSKHLGISLSKIDRILNYAKKNGFIYSGQNRKKGRYYFNEWLLSSEFLETCKHFKILGFFKNKRMSKEDFKKFEIITNKKIKKAGSLYAYFAEKYRKLYFILVKQNNKMRNGRSMKNLSLFKNNKIHILRYEKILGYRNIKMEIKKEMTSYLLSKFDKFLILKKYVDQFTGLSRDLIIRAFEIFDFSIKYKVGNRIKNEVRFFQSCVNKAIANKKKDRGLANGST